MNELLIKLEAAIQNIHDDESAFEVVAILRHVAQVMAIQTSKARCQYGTEADHGEKYRVLEKMHERFRQAAFAE